MADETYRVPCPDCGEVNNLTRKDLGVKLSCGVCEAPFKHDAPLKEERARVKQGEREALELQRGRRARQKHLAKAERIKELSETDAKIEAERREWAELQRPQQERASKNSPAKGSATYFAAGGIFVCAMCILAGFGTCFVAIGNAGSQGVDQQFVTNGLLWFGIGLLALIAAKRGR